MRKIFNKLNKEPIDFNQKTVTQILMNDHKDILGKWPTDYNQSSHYFLDIDDRNWITRLWVHQTTTTEFINDITRSVKNQQYTYVLVYPHDPNDPKSSQHCVYVKKYDSNHAYDKYPYGYLECINSDPTDKFPRIAINRKGNRLYRISCTADEMKKQNKTVTQSMPKLSQSQLTNPKMVPRVQAPVKNSQDDLDSETGSQDYIEAKHETTENNDTYLERSQSHIALNQINTGQQNTSLNSNDKNGKKKTKKKGKKGKKDKTEEVKPRVNIPDKNENQESKNSSEENLESDEAKREAKKGTKKEKTGILGFFDSFTRWSSGYEN